MNATTTSTPRRNRGLRELALLFGLYVAYSATRNLFGSGSVDPAVAYDNAVRVLEWERALGADFELALQRVFLDMPAVVWAANVFYGTMHFLVPAVVLIALWKRRPDAYPLRRTALLFTTGLGLLGFSMFPLMPPRLLCDCEFGSGVDSGFVDTLAVHGGLWSFDSSAMQAVSNQYAAMPSLHMAWALWCVLAAQVLLRRRWVKVATFAYPVITLWVIVVTANHYWLDAVGGAAVVAVGWWGSSAIYGLSARRGEQRPSPPTAHLGDTVTGGSASSEQATAQ